MLLRSLFVLLFANAQGISPVPVPVGSPYLTCKVYELVHEYSLKVQPNLTSAQSNAIRDALRLDECNTTKRAPHSNEDQSRRRFPIPHSDGVTVYVDSVRGDDSAGGTLDAPLRTIRAAQSKTRSASGASTIILRGGVYYLNSTLELTPLDSGLTIQNYDGEEAVVSGATPLGSLEWKPHDIRPHDQNTTMNIQQDTNCVGKCAKFGDNTTACPFYGVTPDAKACSAACLASDSCIAFTWHAATQPKGSQGWEKQCYLVTKAAPLSCFSETDHTSGVKRSVDGWRNVYVASVPADSFPAAGESFTGLRVDGKRAIRARWPNGDPETTLFPDGWQASSGNDWIAPVPPPQPSSPILVTTPNRSDLGPCDSTEGYCNYITGVGGACAANDFFSPPSGYWCNSNPPRGEQYTIRVPSGLKFDETAFDGRKWSAWRANETILNAFRDGHWFSYSFLVDGYDPDSREMRWTKGGFQGAEGSSTAQEWYVENVFEELDSPNEWYYDANERLLYWFYNGTGAPAPKSVEATRLIDIITVVGGGSARGETDPHVTDVTLRGLTFTGAALSNMEPHGLPSDGGGDWAISRRAAVVLEGVERATIDGCFFQRLDGNAVVISGYSRNTTIRNNEFYLLGENGVISWGYTADFPDVKRPVPIPKGQGPDARDGNHPQGTLLETNIFHEIGIFQKQVSCYFQAQSQQSTHRGNICFNGPRAGYNFNDGMGGGHLLDSNIIFNMVRETQDHGTFNSWDRQPFFVERDGQSTYVPLYNEIQRNFFINNYNPQEAIDNDDGSSYYKTHDNVFPFSSSGLKNDFGGHDNHHYNNLYYNSGACMRACAQKPGHEDAFYNNTCILPESTDYASYSEGIGGEAYPDMHDNRVFTKDGTATEGPKKQTVAQVQKQGRDLGTTVSTLPSDDEVVAMARAMLGL